MSIRFATNRRLLLAVAWVSAAVGINLLPSKNTVPGLMSLGLVTLAAIALTRRPVRTWTTAHPHATATGLALLAMLLLSLSAYSFRPTLVSMQHYRPAPGGPRSYYDPVAPWLFVLGVIATLMALYYAPRRVPHPDPVLPHITPARPRWTWLMMIPGLLMLLAVSEINGDLIGVERLRNIAPVYQLALLGGGSALVVVSLGGLRELVPAPSKATYLELLLLVALTAGALWVRMYDLGERIHVMVDEAHFALGAAAFDDYDNIRLLEPMPTTASFPFIYSYGQSAAVDIFGHNFKGLRAFSALLGALTIPAVYWLGRNLYDRLTGLLAALVLLTFPPHLHYSRLALNNIADPLFGTLALAFLTSGLRSNRRLDYALSGAMLGLTQYFYEGGRLMYPALMAGWLVAGWLLWAHKPSLRGVIMLGLVFVVVAAPIYYTLIGLDFPIMDRSDKVQLNDFYWSYEREPNNAWTRVRHFYHSLMMYVHSPENTVLYYYLYYGGKHPLIQEYAIPAFMLGIAVALWAWRKPGVLPLLWVLLVSLGNAMLIESAVTARYVVVFPALALLIAAGMRYTLPLIWPPRWQRAALTGVLLALFGALAVGQGLFYYGPFLDRFNIEVRAHVSHDGEDALLRSLDFPVGTHIHIISPKSLPQTDAERFLGFMGNGVSVTMMRPDELTLERLKSLPRDINLAFFVPPDQANVLAMLDEVFELTMPQFTTNKYVPREKALWLYYIPADPTIQPQQVVG